MTEVRILTVSWNAATGAFDDSGLRYYLKHREVLRAEPQFFVHGGRPYWTVYLETRALHGTEPQDLLDSESTAKEPVAAVMQRLLSELDEDQRARYERILAWRSSSSGREGVPPFVLCTNRQAMELARRSPHTLSALGQVPGFGKKRVSKYGKQILEVLHGRLPGKDGGAAGLVGTVDGHDQMAAGPNQPVSETAAPLADGADRGHDPGGSGATDERPVQQEPQAGVGDDQRGTEPPPDLDPSGP